MKTRILSVLLTLCMASQLLPAFPVITAQAATDSGTSLWEYEVYGDGVELTKYLGDASDVYVPATVEDENGERLSVIRLADSLFENNDALNSATLGTGITEIGAKAFYDCDNLVCIVTNNELTTIGEQAFDSCDVFNSVILYDTVTAIAPTAFDNCPKLTIWCNESSAAYTHAVAYNIPYEILNPDATPETVTFDGITYYIGNGVAIAINGTDTSMTKAVIPSIVNGYPVTEIRETFKNCSLLTSVILPEGLKVIGAYTFYNCSALTDIDLPDSIIEICDSAFFNCRALTGIKLPSNLTYIDKYAFSRCTNLISLSIPDSVIEIGERAFSSCVNLTYINLPSEMTSIGDEAFLSCQKLINIKIPYGIKNINYRLFGYCTNLTTVIIPDSVTHIKDSAFIGCCNLSNVTLPDTITHIYDNAFEVGINSNSGALHCLRVPPSVTFIGSFAFSINTALIVDANSYAHTYALNNEHTCHIYDSNNTPEIYIDNNITYCISNNEATAISCDYTLTDIIIPESINGYPVIAIRGTFINHSSLTSVSLPNSLKTIGKYSFKNCTKLKSIVLPDSVTSIESFAFDNCSQLSNITLSKSLKTIKVGTFSNCTNLASINIFDGLITIENDAFSNCTSLLSIEVPNSVTSIGANAFSGCSSLSKINLPNNISKISAYTFSKCSKLTSIEIPDSVTTISQGAFSSCTALCEVSIPSSVVSISSYAFYNCTSLTNVIVPESVTELATDSFPSNTILVVLENSYAHVFAENNGLLYYIWDGADKPQLYTIDGVTYCIVDNEAVATSFDSSVTEIIIPSTVSSYPVSELRGTFKNCSSLVSVTLPDSVKIIGDYAFYNCSKLTDITIPNSVTNIGKYAFAGCSKITSIEFPSDSIIESFVFKDCSSLTDVILPKNITTIGNSFFENCTNLKNVTIPNTVESIGDSAFSHCSSLTTIILPAGLKSIGYSSFSTCTNLTDLIIPSGVISIGLYAFENCHGLAEITIPDSVTNMGAYTFDECNNLTKVTLSDSATYIGTDMFHSCEKLKSITLPDNIISIGNRAFSFCKDLSNVNLSNNITSIGENAFQSCSNLKSVVIPESVVKVYTNSFPNTTILCVYENSYAHTFAVENNLLYFIIRETANPEIAYGTGIGGTVSYTDGSAAAGATVEIVYDDGAVKEAVTADETGAYAFTYAEVGRYTIRATDAGGNTATTQASVKRMNAFDVFAEGDTALTLKQGWNVSGTVSDASTVTLTDDEGNVIASVECSDGTFSISDIPNGEYIIKAESASGSIAQEITVFNGDVSGVELVIPTDTATIWGYVEVEDREFKHHRRNWVQVTLYNAEGVAVAQQKSGEDGMYYFPNLPVGEYTVVAETAEMRPDRHHGFDRSHTLTGYAYVNAATAGEYQAETIVLYEENDSLAIISGKVTAQGESQACEVILRNVFRHEIAKCSTGSNGKYTFKNVRDGLYFIIARTESDGMGMRVVMVRGGKVYGETDITIYKADKIKDWEDKFKDRIPECKDRDEAEQYRDKIAEEKRHYDGLSEKEKKQLSKEYVERLDKLCKWMSGGECTSDDGITVEQGGLVVSGDELERGSSIQFELKVEKKDGHTPSTDGVHNKDDFIHHRIEDTSGDREIKQYYEISMYKTTDGETKEITSVAKDTDADGKFRITLPIPEEYRGYRHYSVIHVHHGKPVTLTDLDDDPDTITFEVDKFSTFALTVTDAELTIDSEASTTVPDNFGTRNACIRAMTDENTKCKVTLLAGIDSLKYQKVGFMVTVAGKTQMLETRTVYTAVNVLSSSGKTRVEPADFQGNSQYIMGQVINFGEAFKDETITYTPYVVDHDGNYIYGKESTISPIFLE